MSADVSAVNELQDQYTLTPLSLWGENAKLPERRDVWKPFDAETDPLAEWKTMNRAMTGDPPEPRLLQLVSLFGKIGVGPGQDVDKTDEATKRGLTRAALDGRKLLKDAIDSGALGKQVNNWNIPPRTYGRAGLNDDFLLRASLQCLGGIVANEPEEAVYYNTTKDGAGQILGWHQTLHDALRPWSMAEGRSLLVHYYVRPGRSTSAPIPSIVMRSAIAPRA